MPTAPKQHRPPGWQAARKDERKQHDRWRGSATERGYNNAWRKHAQALRQERAICELCMESTGTVTPAADDRTGMVDHTIPVTGPDDPLFWEPANHRVLCIACDRWKSNKFDGGFRGRSQAMQAVRTVDGVARRWWEVVESRKAVAANSDLVAAGKVTFVVGPPASGKTTWVANHRKGDDLVWDADVVATAITGASMYDSTFRVWPQLAAMLTPMIATHRTMGNGNTLWVILSSISRCTELRQDGDTVHVMDTPPDECKRRLIAEQRPWWQQRCEAVDKWEREQAEVVQARRQGGWVTS